LSLAGHLAGIFGPDLPVFTGNVLPAFCSGHFAPEIKNVKQKKFDSIPVLFLRKRVWRDPFGK
jgi:hypothetical protein